MTTLFPQIKRVDEDETSKIIKNVLFDDQDEVKLEQIFDEFMHLTEESITYSDADDYDEDDEEASDSSAGENEDDDDDAEDEDDAMSSSGADPKMAEDNDEDESEEEDDDGEEEEEEDDTDSDSDKSDSSDESEEDDKSDVKMETAPVATRPEPTSWNLDQFIKTIPVTTKNAPSNNHSTAINNNNHHKQLTPEPQPTPEPIQPTPTPESVHLPEPVPSPVPPQPQFTINTSSTINSNNSHSNSTTTNPTSSSKHRSNNNHISASLSSSSSNNTTTTTTTTTTTPTTTNGNNNINSSSNSSQKLQQQETSGSYIVSFDLSKLKRIPITKVPTPQSTASNSIVTAKALKHEADAEKDKTKQAIKYLESAMYFVLHGYEIENSARDSKNISHVSYYYDTIPLFKHVLRLSSIRPENHHQDNMTNLKIQTLSLKCLGMLHMKLYKFKEPELLEHHKTIKSHQNSSSPIQQAGSLLIGIKPQLLRAYEKQTSIYINLRYANDFWQQADQLCDQHPAVRIFFSTIESNCGSLTMISQFTKLLDHVKCGLKLLRTS